MLKNTKLLPCLLTGGKSGAYGLAQTANWANAIVRPNLLSVVKSCHTYIACLIFLLNVLSLLLCISDYYASYDLIVDNWNI